MQSENVSLPDWAIGTLKVGNQMLFFEFSNIDNLFRNSNLDLLEIRDIACRLQYDL